MFSLDGIVFSIDELPEEIPLGGEQQLSVRKLAGGSVDIQTLGAFENQITWSAALMYEGAIDRANKIDKLRISGNPVKLIAESFTRTVVIQAFNFNYRNDSNIPYSITLQPIEGLNATVNGIGMTSTSDIKHTIANSNNPDNTKKTKNIQYVIKNGDSLWKLASVHYKDGSKWVKIADDNNIKNAKSIKIGTKITIYDSLIG